MAQEITKEIVDATYHMLCEGNGIEYFTRELLQEGDWIHLHMFGGGMQVRNFLRGTGLCDDWDAHDLDNNWMEVVRKAIMRDPTSQKLLKNEDFDVDSSQE